MSPEDAACQRLEALEARIREAAPALPEKFYQLREQLRQILEQHCSGRLRHKIRDIKKPLYTYTEPDNLGYAVIVGGERTEHWSGPNQFERDDGARFNFTIDVCYPPGGEKPSLIAYHFNLSYPGHCIPPFLRFDLNDADFLAGGGRNAVYSPLLCHVHPGHAKMTIPSPVLAPQEVLDILLWQHLRA